MTKQKQRLERTLQKNFSSQLPARSIRMITLRKVSFCLEAAQCTSNLQWKPENLLKSERYELNSQGPQASLKKYSLKTCTTPSIWNSMLKDVRPASSVCGEDLFCQILQHKENQYSTYENSHCNIEKYRRYFSRFGSSFTPIWVRTEGTEMSYWILNDWHRQNGMLFEHG